MAAGALAALPQARLLAQAYPPAFPRTNATKLFETERITVWAIVWPKAQPTPMHRHVYDQVGTYYSPGGRRITTPDGESRLTATEAGSLSNTRAGTTHIEEGTTDPPLRAVFIELKRVPDRDRPPSSGDDLTIGPKNLANPRVLMDDQRVRVCDFTWSAPGTVRFGAAYDTVFVWLGTGETRYIPRGAPQSIEIPGRPARSFTFEIK